MPVYASPDDLKDYMFGESSTEAPPAGAEVLLRQASDMMRDFTKQAVYETDENQLPVDPDLLEAFNTATCAQAAYWAHRNINPEAGQTGARVAQSKSLGSASVSYVVASSQADHEYLLATGAVLYAGAYRILRQAGLITTNVDTILP